MNDNAALEKSIREEADKTLRSIEDKVAAEIRKLNEAHTFEIDKFKKAKEAEIKEKIEQELSKLDSRTILERKKLKLGFIEGFISRIVDEAVKVMRNDARYKKFLIDTIAETIGQIQEKAEIFLKPEDLVFKKDIEDEVKQGKNSDIIIKEDTTIKWGGCIIHDQHGRIFNSTIERIYFRKSPAIRQEVMNILKQKGFIE
jgi:flagellar biosynthesis/type III secretory pathway protein FliH